MLPPGLNSPREVVLQYDKVYYNLIDSGKAHPFIYPWATLGAAVVFAYLLIDHRQSPVLKWCRYPVFAFLCAFQLWCILTNRARNPAASLGVGLLSCWAVMWVGAIMIWNDCQTDFKRVERYDGSVTSPPIELESRENGVNGTTTALKADIALTQRKPAPSKSATKRQSTKKPAQRTGPLFWQSYPITPLLERVDWIADAFCSFRGVGWSWQTSGIPPPPSWVQAQLDGNYDVEEKPEAPTVSRTGVRRYGDRAQLVRDSFQNVIIGYLVLDLCVTLMHKDPYFWGYVDAPAPQYLPEVLRSSYFLTKSYRLLLSLAGIYFALWAIFKLGPLFFCGVLGPRVVGLRGEAWLNPADMYGSFSLVLDKGLAGWWGGWWHQTFRFAFEAPATWLMALLKVDKRSPTGKVLGLFIAFLISGCIHAAGSYTLLGDTMPFMGPMRFFLLQGVGICVQTLVNAALAKTGIPQKLPKSICQATNLVVVHIWLYYTAPLLVDDFARGGVWLFEPVALSPLRGLGLGAPDDRFFCWWNGPVWWRSGKHWWDTGIAL